MYDVDEMTRMENTMKTHNSHIVFCDDFVAEKEFELSDLDLKESLRQQQKFMTGSGNKKSESVPSPMSSNRVLFEPYGIPTLNQYLHSVGDFVVRSLQVSTSNI